MNPHKILGVRENASKALIKKAYLKKIKEFPPEKYPKEFKEIRAAYEKIKDGGNALQSARLTDANARVPKDMLEDLQRSVFPELTVNDMIRLTF